MIESDIIDQLKKLKSSQLLILSYTNACDTKRKYKFEFRKQYLGCCVL